MPNVYVCKIDEFDGNAARLVREGELEIGVYRRGNSFYAYENLCVHQGGPACEGITMHKVEEIIRPDKTYAGMRFDMDEEHIVCPWHGYEYRMKTGECVPNPRLRLRKFEVVTQGDSVYVVV